MSKTMVAEQEARAWAGAGFPVGEPVTLVIDEERFAPDQMTVNTCWKKFSLITCKA